MRHAPLRLLRHLRSRRALRLPARFGWYPRIVRTRVLVKVVCLTTVGRSWGRVERYNAMCKSAHAILMPCRTEDCDPSTYLRIGKTRSAVSFAPVGLKEPVPSPGELTASSEDTPAGPKGKVCDDVHLFSLVSVED